MKRIYLLRHCKAAGQETSATLTPEGEEQALQVAARLSDKSIGRILSSPSRRALQSVEPFAQAQGLAIETDERLLERVLCGQPNPDWLEMLRASFRDPELCYENGESGRAAQARVCTVVDEVWDSSIETTLIVSHGNLLALLLQKFDTSFGFEDWQAMTNPDLFQVDKNSVSYHRERIWN